MNEVKAEYKNIIDGVDEELKSLKVRFTYMYIVRLVVFFAFIALMVVYCTDGTAWTLYASLLSLVGFGVLVKLDLKYIQRSKYLKAKRAINHAELEILEGRYDNRPTGEEYAAYDIHLTTDFDIVGNGSLFQYLDRSSTRLGEQRFVENLCSPEQSAQAILARQKAIEELSAKVDFVQDFQVYGSYFDESSSELDYLRHWASEDTVLSTKLNVAVVVMPLLVVLWVALVVMGVLPALSLSLPFVVNLFVVNINMHKLIKGHNKLDRTSKIIRKYAKLISLIESRDFESNYLVESKSRLYSGGVSASELSSRLFNLLNILDSRQNLFTALVLNSLCGFDLQIYYRLLRWKRDNGAFLASWFDTIADFDSLLGLAVFAHNNSADTVLPEVDYVAFGFTAKALAHPLMDASRRVSNDICIEKSPAVVIITGANMAGKSTFLRTVAVNLILAMNGARVCAREFTFAPSNILSSIKIQDSLAKNESYFYAEISRLKHIVEQVAGPQRTLVVLDEILRGTNNKDKQQGSMGLLRKLMQDNAIVFVATHDLVIGELENQYPDIARNYCFEVELEGDKLVFDYKLKNGISQKLNASFLLHKMGLID